MIATKSAPQQRRAFLRKKMSAFKALIFYVFQQISR